MSELLAEYTASNFPYSYILEELTDEVKDQGLTPVEAYASFLDKRDERWLSPQFDYASTSITTGGHAHHLDNIGEVIASNTRTAREMVALLDQQGTIFGQRVVLPVDMGNTGWTQSEFMTYWGLTIAGADVREFRSGETGFARFERTLSKRVEDRRADLEVMNSSKVDREERRPHYDRFVNALMSAIEDERLSCLPAYRMISLVDPQISLGCWAEARLADKLNVPLQRVAPVKLSSVDEAVPFERLREDMKVIMAAGGSVLVAPRDSILTLVSSNAPSLV